MYIEILKDVTNSIALGNHEIEFRVQSTLQNILTFFYYYNHSAAGIRKKMPKPNTRE